MHSAEFTASPSPDCAPGSCGMPPSGAGTDASASMMACTRAISASTSASSFCAAAKPAVSPASLVDFMRFTMPCFLFSSSSSFFFMWFSSFKSKSSVDFLRQYRRSFHCAVLP